MGCNFHAHPRKTATGKSLSAANTGPSHQLHGFSELFPLWKLMSALNAVKGGFNSVIHCGSPPVS
jgi:hypothetical protein